MEGLTEGRMVHFVMQNGEHRPAVVVKVWNTDGTANLQVWTDGANDTWGVPDSDPRKSAIEHGHRKLRWMLPALAGRGMRKLRQQVDVF